MSGFTDRDDKDQHGSGCDSKRDPNHDYKKDGPDGRDCDRPANDKEPTQKPDPNNSPFPY